MAYPSQCGGTRIPYFSNPYLTYGSPALALGDVQTANVVRVHNENAYAVANFRAAASGGTSCTYALSPSGATAPAAGGAGTTSLSTASDCNWSAVSSASWLNVTSSSSGSGSAVVSYAVEANSGGVRSANLTIGGTTFIVSQDGGATTPPPPAAAPVATLSPTALSFGSVQVGRVGNARSATLANSGGGTLAISSISMTGDSQDFAAAGTCAVGGTLASGETCLLSYSYAPKSSGSSSATVTVTTTSNSVTLQLTGNSKKPGRK